MTIGTAVATLAIILSFYSIWLARDHNRLSVKPLLVTHSLREWDNNGVKLSVYISNCGVGPAVLSSFEFLVDGKETGSGQSGHVKQAIRMMMGDSFHFRILSVSEPKQDHVIRAGEEYALFTIRIDEVSKADEQWFIETVDGGDLVIGYRSLYGTLFHHDTRDQP